MMRGSREVTTCIRGSVVMSSNRDTWCTYSELFKELCKILKIRKTNSSPYYPQSNGLVERTFKTMKVLIEATMGKEKNLEGKEFGRKRIWKEKNWDAC